MYGLPVVVHDCETGAYSYMEVIGFIINYEAPLWELRFENAINERLKL